MLTAGANRKLSSRRLAKPECLSMAHVPDGAVAGRIRACEPAVHCRIDIPHMLA
jgi:hypothetical protein